MSALQTAIIQSYKQKFPNHKLRHISEQTSIQITRVFRILNGSEMKISEYEAFQKCLNHNEQHLKTMDKLKFVLGHSTQRQASVFNMMLNQEIKNIKMREKFYSRRTKYQEAL